MEMTKQVKSSVRTGFSLVELLVAIAIIVTLMGIALGVSGIALRNAAESKARSELGKMTLELEHYRSDQGTYPATLSQLVDWYDVRYPRSYWDLSDLRSENIPVDPWGRDYRYTLPNPNIFRLWSEGADRTNNTAADIHLNR